MIALLEDVVRLFRSPVNHRLIPQLEQAHQRVHGALITLSTYDGDDTALKFWSKEILNSQGRWLDLADVATLPLIEGNENWTTKELPVPYLAKAARNHRLKEETTYGPRDGEIPLDEAPELEAPDTRGGAPLEEVIAAVLNGADSEVKQYGQLILRGDTHEEARRQLGWYKKRGQRVEMRYRRHLKKAARTSDLQTLKQVLASWDSSRTIRKVTFQDEREGRRRGYFEHRENRESSDEI
jgi:hypothetical protein